jgi:hypothetical protein
MNVRVHCPRCLRAADIRGDRASEGTCARCGEPWTFRAGSADGHAEIVERCGVCGNRAFFIQRDFDQRIGCLIMLLSIATAIFIGWKYGWIWFTPVLLATVLIDWALAITVKPVTICYRCDAEYRQCALNSRHRAYDPHIAERYAEKKTVRRMVE